VSLVCGFRTERGKAGAETALGTDLWCRVREGER